MTTQSAPLSPALTAPPDASLRRPDTLFILLACLLFAFAQISWVGYQLGVGNQAIQIPFLEALHNPQLFARDAMIRDTLSQYPSWFFTLAAPLLRIAALSTIYLTLHLLATVGTFLAVVALSRSIFKNDSPPAPANNHWAGLVTVLLMLAGHHQALAGETLYSAGLTHTWVVFPLTLLSLSLFYRENYRTSVALAGIIFNFHALEAGHLAIILAFVGICQWRKIGLTKLLAMGNIFLLTAAPTLVLLLRQHAGQFDALWLQLMHVRSADHSFPSAWWQPGSPDLTRFLCILGLAAVALGFWKDSPQRRKTYLLFAALALTFLAGFLFTDIWPVPIVIRAQFFRSSRVLLVLAFCVIGYGCVSAWRLPWQRAPELPKWYAWLEFASATLTAATLAIPSLLPLLPWALLLATLTALLTGRLAWYQATIAGTGLLVSLIAWQMMQFMIPGASAELPWRTLLEFHGPPTLAWVMLVIAALLWIAAARRPTGLARAYGLVLSSAAAIGLVMAVFPTLLKAPAADAQWVDVQDWARGHTPVESLFLTPAKQSGFRIHSERAIVGEWRDGTQLYFSPAFTSIWWNRMNDLQPGLRLAPGTTEVFDWGHSLAQMEDEQIIELAKRYHADYIVLPYSTARRLTLKYGNQQWAIYQPEIETVATATAPVIDVAQASDFMGRTVQPNIEKYRKSDARVQVVDIAGRPIDGLHYTVSEKRSAFGFGCSLPYFKTPSVNFGSDYVSPAVTPSQLSRFLEMFNYSVIPFSGNWATMESQQGRVDYADLDQYIAWCGNNSVRVEFSALTGNQPAWLQSKNHTEQTRLAVARAHDLVARYGNKIDSWQVVAERMGDMQAAAVFKELRTMSPGIRLGIAEDTRFWSPRIGADKEGDTLRGMEEIRYLKAKGVAVDFISIEAHQPTGLWADPEEMYQTLNAFAKEGLRIHITQLGVPVGGRIEGPVRQEGGGVWTPELQATYYQQFFTICFSHPNVDAVNIFALAAKTWMDGEGMLDEHDQPTPAFLALKELITHKFRTELSGKFDGAGVALFRGFHGDYELTVTLPDGKVLTAPFSVVAGQLNQYRFQLDAATGTLTRMEKR